MTTPRVTEIAVAMAPADPDQFIGVPSRDSVARRRLSERDAGRRARPRRLSYAGRRQSWPSTRTRASENGS